MAEAINYRMNLVIDPKNVIKANRELRAMERYFERIQGRVLKIGRTRMVPEIVLKDSASKGLDSLYEKFNRVKSQVIQASANVNLNVKQSAAANVNPNIQMDFSPMVQALQANTEAVTNLTSTLESLELGGGAAEKESSWLDKVATFSGAVALFGGGVKSFGELPKKRKAVRDAWEGKPEKTKGIIVRRKNKDTLPSETRVEKAKRVKLQNKGRLTTAVGDLIGTAGSAGKGIFGGISELWKSGKDLFGGNSGIVSGIDSGAAKKSMPSNVAKVAPKSSMGSGFMKGFGKRLLGPLAFAADVASIASAEPGKERAKAIGSTVGGGAGAAIGGFIGSIIPGAGTFIGSALGGAAGSWIGEKAGGLISDVGSWIGEKAGGLISGAGSKIKEGASKVSDWFSSKFSFGKKKNPAEDIAEIPSSIRRPTTPAASQAISNALALARPSAPSSAPGPFIPGPVLPTAFAPAPYPGLISPYGPMPPASMAPSLSGGPRMGPAANGNPNATGNKMTPQVVQISPEQMTALSGFLKDFKTETTMNYNLPPGAVQVTVHEEHPVDVEGLILQIGQRLRAEFNKATQNRKPAPKAYV
ncbi:hypothetical protein SAMN05661091_0854 [Paenibacillus uliginis N3/975]|uniref:Tail tape measure protein n=1 Tax=Paenibacillus uliginis N3/975 TaxID=1313296 RepID=A0A1X7GNB8_9BACL|nr:hypothetical protein [Paenibacillus uliginis]SMF72332.1 hypothetical protein SAMN05661091_0854 [Paenibacillus uliginis N3/975]